MRACAYSTGRARTPPDEGAPPVRLYLIWSFVGEGSTSLWPAPRSSNFKFPKLRLLSSSFKLYCRCAPPLLKFRFSKIPQGLQIKIHTILLFHTVYPSKKNSKLKLSAFFDFISSPKNCYFFKILFKAISSFIFI